jgi:ATP-dependent DNA ligase
MAAPFEPPRTPMEAKVREVIPSGAYAYEPKWDGFRCLAWADERRLDSRSAKPLLRYFPELEEALEQLPGGTVVDGEVVVVSDGKLDFDALSQRLHPAESRITKLSVETPAQLVAFDLLADQGEDLRDLPFAERRERLVALADGLSHPWHLTLSTTDRAEGERWFTDFESAGCDGIVCKALGAPYVEGKREMLKIKHRRTVDCVVGGYRLHKEGDRVGSLLLGLHDDDGALHFIGHCSGFGDADRVSLDRGQGPVLGAPAPRAGVRGQLRPADRGAVPARDPVPPLATGQGSAGLHLRPARATGGAHLRGHRRPLSRRRRPGTAASHPSPRS